MAYAVATFELSPLENVSFALEAFRRFIARATTMCLAATAGSVLMVAFLTVTAAWFVAAAFSMDPHLAAKAPHGAMQLAFGSRPRLDIAAGDRLEPNEMIATSATAPSDDEAAAAIAPDSSAAPKYVLASVAPMLPANTFQSANFVTIAEPEDESTSEAKPASGNISVVPSEERSDADDAVVTASISPTNLPPKRPRAAEIWLSNVNSRTAVYDIASHTVFMPDGTMLEAHSGLGGFRDDPSHVRKKNRGPTPPNVYDLKLRESLFHGVRAIRLNPAPGSTMFGRDGILAHTYMLGSNGQSNGCVSFKNYNAFLKAFLRGEVNRMVVVPQLGSTDMAQLRNAQRSSSVE